MAEVKELKVEIRTDRGKRDAKRARRAGRIPAILYGHKLENVALYLSADEFAGVVRHGQHLVQLTGAVDQRAFIKALQWDTFGREILHVDFIRVSKDEKLRLSVSVELRGDAEGIREGGVVRLHTHELEVECTPEHIPEKIFVKVGSLKLNDSLKVSDLVVPEGVKILTDAEEMVVDCVIPIEVEEVTPEVAGSAEPEVIGRKKEDTEEGEEKK
ncbi:MAG: 50S ribosomal protein L25 [Planctomycetia bacterium]|nr:50S ribosomal protein L25 [Planctomycetia bacterium]